MRNLNESYLRKVIREERSIKMLRFPRLASVLFEQADAEKIDTDLYPSKLSQVKPELAKVLATTGQGDADAVKAGDISKPADTLKASQTTMDFGKFVGMAIQMLGKMGKFSGGAGGDLGAIVSNDGHIMDGHHRWAATLMVDPKADVKGLGINLPGEKLVGVLNVWTASKGQKGKPSDTNLADLTGDKVAAKFKEMCEAGGGFLPDPDKILDAFKKEGYDSLDKAADHVKKNWDSTAKQRTVEGWMPPKVDMPAIEPEQLPDVKSDITSGKMDINPDYSKEVKDATGKTESISRKDSVVMERWQKLAGILKD